MFVFCAFSEGEDHAVVCTIGQFVAAECIFFCDDAYFGVGEEEVEWFAVMGSDALSVDDDARVVVGIIVVDVCDVFADEVEVGGCF